jgi:hypothetical protein
MESANDTAVSSSDATPLAMSSATDGLSTDDHEKTPRLVGTVAKRYSTIFKSSSTSSDVNWLLVRSFSEHPRITGVVAIAS